MPCLVWYGAEFVCFIPLLSINHLNSSLVKEEPLSVTIVRSSPWVAKTALSVSIDLDEVMVDMM